MPAIWDSSGIIVFMPSIFMRFIESIMPGISNIHGLLPPRIPFVAPLLHLGDLALLILYVLRAKLFNSAFCALLSAACAMSIAPW